MTTEPIEPIEPEQPVQPTDPTSDRPHQRGRDDIDRELEQMLVEAEQTASRLRAELAAYRAQCAEEDQQELQHLEIDRLDEHLRNSRIRWDEVRAFLEEALRELGWRRDRDADAHPTGADAPEAAGADGAGATGAVGTAAEQPGEDTDR